VLTTIGRTFTRDGVVIFGISVVNAMRAP
jgi:hypothetical protein